MQRSYSLGKIFVFPSNVSGYRIDIGFFCRALLAQYSCHTNEGVYIPTFLYTDGHIRSYPTTLCIKRRCISLRVQGNNMPRAITEIVYECPHCAKDLAAAQSLSDVYAEVLTTRSWLCVTSSAPPKNFRLNVYKLQSRVHVHISKKRNRKSHGYGSAGKETARTISWVLRATTVHITAVTVQ